MNIGERIIFSVESFSEKARRSVLSAIDSRRQDEANKELASRLKRKVEADLDELASDLAASLGRRIVLLDTEYTAEIGSGRGAGKNLLKIKRSIEGPNRRGTIYGFVDVIDGTWNASCGLPFSCSTTISFTDPMDGKRPDDLSIGDFRYGFIIPYFGHGIYIGVRDMRPTIKLWNEDRHTALFMSRIEDQRRARVIIDLFTELSQEALSESIKAVVPVIYEWCDFGRFYGAGFEVASLFGYYNIDPGFSAYIAASQKSDNVVPMYHLVLGAGGIVTDWWNQAISNKKLTDRIYVIMSANAILHKNLVQHLSKRSKEGR